MSNIKKNTKTKESTKTKVKLIAKKDIKLKQPKKSAHKGDNGKVLIIGGSEDYVGCLVFAGISALRSGTDWVTIAAPKKVAWAINALTPDLVTKKFSGNYFTQKHVHDIKKLIKKHDAVLIGNGMGTKKETRQFVKKIITYLAKSPQKCVIDADALSMIRLQDINNAILTPHKKECELLLQNSNATVQNFQSHLKNNILLLKGPVDYIYAKTKIYANKTGEKRMRVAGTGDILAGLCSGFCAQGYSLVESACYAAFFCGKLGEKAFEKRKDHYLASDLLKDIRSIIRGVAY